jgi:hypothetical protein
MSFLPHPRPALRSAALWLGLCAASAALAQNKPPAGDDLLSDSPPAAKSPATPPAAPASTPPKPADAPHPPASPADAKPGGASIPLPHAHPEMSPGTKLVPHDRSVFGPDPAYADKPYDPQAQLDIYGAKHLVPTQRPLLELGRELYQYGPFTPSPTLLGETNPLHPQLLVFGDYRTAVAYNDNGAAEQATWAHRLNLDVDLRFTATERVHAFFRPLDKGNQFTRLDFGGENHEFEEELDANLDALFFEGDLGNIFGGFAGTDAKFDLPITGGLIPLLFQNGVWLEDAFTGLAFSIPARNSAALDWSNFDITFFAGLDKVTTGAMPGEEGRAHIYGLTAFIEALQGYWEVGYAYTYDSQNLGLDYHNFSIAYTRRYFNWLSNSVRLVTASGQDPDSGKQTADGLILLIENSLITSKPSTFVPYFNFFAGFDRPQSVARDAGAGGILKNTGINFETDGLTGFPKLDDTGFNTWGGAVGVNLLGDSLDQQLVVEFAMVQAERDAADRTAPGDQYGFGVRYQRPITNAIILRVDAMYGIRQEAEDLSGVRLEFRYKF